MKNLLFLSFFLALFMVGCGDEPTTDPDPEPMVEPFLASTDQSNRNAVLEDYTGVRCGFCPAGHTIAEGMIAANPGRVVVIADHCGSYAAPQSGWANLTSQYGEALKDQADVGGYPAGSVNRTLFTGRSQRAGTAMSRGSWATSGTEILSQPSYVNIGSKAVYDPATNEITVDVHLYYTSDAPADQHINVAFLQSGIFTKQSGGGDSYNQKHVLRDFLTGQWGDVVSADECAEGTEIRKTYTYTPPADYNGAVIPPGGGTVEINNCEIAIYVAEGTGEVQTGIYAEIEQ